MVKLDQVAEKIRVLLTDKLVTLGQFVELYTPVYSGTTGAVACTCTKDTTETADRACLTCFGTKYAPGYEKFLHKTWHWSSSEAFASSTNVEVGTSIKSNKAFLAEGETTGEIVTSGKTYTNPNLDAWELRLDTYLRATGSTATLEYTINGGDDWTAVALTNNEGSITGAALGTSGTIAFRITLTRLSADDLSPAFEILRLRRFKSEGEPLYWVERRRQDYVQGSILVLKPWTQEQDFLEPGRGRVIDHLATRSWTAPLDFFDLTLTHDTPQCKIEDHAGPHAFYKISTGFDLGTIYPITKIAYSEKFGIFTHQVFDDRRAQAGEPYHLVW